MDTLGRGDGTAGRGGRDFVGVVEDWFILWNSNFKTCSFCSHVKSEISTFSPVLTLHMYMSHACIMIIQIHHHMCRGKITGTD